MSETAGVEDDIQTLVRLGLNGVQAKIYLGLLRTGLAKAQEIAKASGVARPDVYRTLAQLQEIGLVEKMVTTPIKFKALPINYGLQMLLKQREKENTDIQKKASQLIKSYQNTDENLVPQTSDAQFVLIPKKETIVHTVQEIAKKTQTHMYFMTPLKKLLPLIINHPDIFSAATKRGVNVQILTEKPEEKTDLTKPTRELNKHPNFELRMILTPLNVDFGIFDDQKILLSTAAKTNPTQAPAIFSNNPDIIELAKNYFEIAWITAIETKPTPKN
ncbi:MAG: helix-turn-helix domain-containing protein [Candidatus Bathyarchaeota archaeon]|nr:helix-turn-helix domain-containing protein [Candidatus Bathyarchaeota archaeon]